MSKFWALCGLSPFAPLTPLAWSRRGGSLCSYYDNYPIDSKSLHSPHSHSELNYEINLVFYYRPQPIAGTDEKGKNENVFIRKLHEINLDFTLPRVKRNKISSIRNIKQIVKSETYWQWQRGDESFQPWVPTNESDYNFISHTHHHSGSYTVMPILSFFLREI